MDRLLTKAEKNAIRNSPCGKCGAVPPYPDGSWTQKHRIVPGSKGGRYTLKNTVPRCPKCHSKEPDHNTGFIMLSPAKQRERGRKGGRRSNELHPQKGKYFSTEHRANISAAKRSKTHRGAHTRWHVNRGIVNPHCPFCRVR